MEIFLSEGVKRMAEKLGKNALRYAMHIKGMKIPGQDRRTQKSMIWLMLFLIEV